MSNIIGHRGFKGRPILIVFTLAVVFLLIYFYQNSQRAIQSLKRNQQKCNLEQEFLSTRLQAVIDYKEHMEKTLENERTEHSKNMKSALVQHQEERDALKEHLKAIKGQSDDLNIECNKLRDMSKDLLSKLKLMEDENTLLKKRIYELMETKPSQFSHIHFIPADAQEKTRFISKQTKVENDVYYIGTANLTINNSFNNSQKQLKLTSESIDLKEPKLLLPFLGNTSSTSASPKAKGNIPQGLPPELIVNDHLMDNNHIDYNNGNIKNNENSNVIQAPDFGEKNENDKANEDWKNFNDELEAKNNINEVDVARGDLPLRNNAMEEGEKVDQVDNPGNDANLSPNRGNDDDADY